MKNILAYEECFIDKPIVKTIHAAPLCCLRNIERISDKQGVIVDITVKCLTKSNIIY